MTADHEPVPESYRVVIEHDGVQRVLLVRASGEPEHVMRVLAHSIALGVSLLDGETAEE